MMDNQDLIQDRLAKLEASIGEIRDLLRRDLEKVEVKKPPVAPVTSASPITPPKPVVKKIESAMANTSVSEVGERKSVKPEETVAVEKNDDALEPKGPPLGEVGVFDGEFVNLSNERRYQVPPGYASKAMLVTGDKLKLIATGDMNSFRVVEQVPRVELTGILTKKNFQWAALVEQTEFRLIAASVRFFNGDIGDKVVVVVPTNYKEILPSWAALKEVIKTNMSQGGFAGSRSGEEIMKEKKTRFTQARQPITKPANEIELKSNNGEIAVIPPVVKPVVKSESIESKPTSIPEKPLPKDEVAVAKPVITAPLIADLDEVPPLR